jgi:exonuclease SbcD
MIPQGDSGTMLRVLHTSDWHLGHNLFHKDRRLEHGQFLDWLLQTLTEREVDALIIAGDIFDTVAPPNYAMALYYDFLRRLAQTPCRQAVIIGGNHDSAASLHAPRELLKFFNIQVVGSPDREHPGHDLIVLRDRHDQPIGVVGAIPFLRERDVRRAVAGESHDDKSRSYLEGVSNHYETIRSLGRARIAELCGDEYGLPLIGTGHLMAAGGEMSDGERDVTVGTLGGIPAAAFATGFDYLALGHLHKTQNVKGPCPVHYSGSPLPLSFSEAGSLKEVTLVSFKGGMVAPELTAIPVPGFQALRTVRGDWGMVEAFFKEIDSTGQPLWLEIQLEALAWGPGVQERVDELARGKAVEVLAVRNCRHLLPHLTEEDGPQEVLTTLTPLDVFSRRLLQAEGVSQEDLSELMPLYQEIVATATRMMEGATDED